jgi:hypothetical protein
MAQSPPREANRFSARQEIFSILWQPELSHSQQLSLPWARSIHSIPPQPTTWRYILILFSHLRMGLPNGLFPLSFPNKILYSNDNGVRIASFATLKIPFVKSTIFQHRNLIQLYRDNGPWCARGSALFESGLPTVKLLRADSHYASRFRSVTFPSSFRQNGLCSHCPLCLVTFQYSTW